MYIYKSIKDIELYSYLIYIYIYPLVMTNIAMENPNHKWRFSSLGKSSISMGHRTTMAMLVITRGYIKHIYIYP